MIFNGFDVLLKTFSINPEINSTQFKGSNGRTKHRVRSNNPVNWDSNVTFNFQDYDKALEFTESLKPLQSYDLQIDAGDVDFIAPEMTKTGGVTKVFLKTQPKISVDGFKSVNVEMRLTLDKSNVTPPESCTPFDGVYKNYFIGNGVDSGVDLGSTAFTDVIALHVKIKLNSSWNGYGNIFTYCGSENGSIYSVPPFEIYILPSRNLRVACYNSNPTDNASGRKFIKTSNLIPLDTEVEITCSLNLTNPSNQIKLFINGVMATALTSDNDSFSSVYSLISPRALCGIGYNLNGYYSGFNGEIQDLYWSTNPLAIDKATIVQYADRSEHFTRNFPDVPLSDWIGGAVQGAVEIEPPVVCDGVGSGDFDGSFIWSIPWKWEYNTGALRGSEFHETYSGGQSITGDLVTGHSAKFSYILTYEEYIEILKNILWGVRYSDFLWDGEISVFAKGSSVRITKFNFKYTGKRMYSVDLVIESV